MRKKVLIANLTSCKITQTAGLYQYDYGQVLNIIGTGIDTTVQVHFANGTGDALVVLANPDGDTLVAEIPNELLESSGTITAYIYYTDETSGQTVYKVIIPVIERAKPAEYTPTPQEKSVIDEAIEALQKNKLSVATKEIEGGTELTITDRNGNHIINIMDGTDGLDGVGIESITTEESQEPGGANIVTITMTDGTEYTFDVLNGRDGSDGQDGDDGVGIENINYIPSSVSGGTNTLQIMLSNEQGGSYPIKNGEGIASVEQTTTSTESEGVNEVTVTLTNGNTSTFEVRNGKAGNGIKSIEQTETSTSPLGVNEITVTMDDDTEETFQIRNGAIPQFDVSIETKPATATKPEGYHAIITTSEGEQTMDIYNGAGIKSIETQESQQPGAANVVTINLEDGTSRSFNVLNGPKYELTASDKQDIADIVINTLGSADTMAY